MVRTGGQTATHLIYHFTSVANLPSMLAEGRICCDTTVQARGLLQVEAGDRDIKSRRRQVSVPVSPYGCPADYVPFYFAPRSPMMLKIKSGQVPTYSGGQRPLVHLVSSAERVAATEHTWVYSDGNCANDLTDYYTDLSDIDQVVDWDVMRARIWKNTAEDGDRMRRRMAEFLVHQELQWEALLGIGTFDETRADQVREILRTAGRSEPVRVRRDWYY
ncbi:DUF4433 domain-containing protein [Kribbella sancticallisti]|uniref:DUF4433 domain-containing protein n=1 Tax=Kribbella sancticallisti TaxID=460087 RepID=A0ABN2ECS2_9ACTN